jgi:hypothetical protein
LTLVGYSILPVQERTLRIVAPCPDVRFEEIGQVKTVRRSNKLKVLPIECRRRIAEPYAPKAPHPPRRPNPPWAEPRCGCRF